MNSYKINAGDTLSGIALKNGTTVQALLKANPTITDPNKIAAGASLFLPTAPMPAPAATTPPANSFMVNQPVPTTNYGSNNPISVSSLMQPVAPYTPPTPVNNAPAAAAALSAATAAVHNNYQGQDLGQPIVGTPTVAFITVDGKNYAANPADRVGTSNPTPGSGTTTTTPPAATSTTTPDLNTAGGIKDKLLALLGLQGTKAAETAAANTQYGVDTKTQALTDLQNTAITTKASYDKQIADIQASNPGGQLTGAQQETIAKITKQRDQALADNAIQTLVAQNNLSAAITLSKNKIDAEFAPIQDEIDTLKTYFSIFTNDMTDSQKMQAQAAITKQQDDADALKTAKSNAVTTLIEAGQYTQDKANIINNAKTPDAVNQALVGVKKGGTAASGLTSTQVNDGAVRSGLDVASFKGLPADVQIYFSQTSDSNIQPIKDELSKVASGDESAADFSKFLDNQSMSSTVRQFLNDQATQLASAAPKKSGGAFANFLSYLGF